ncbi:MAG: hypothetical protein P8Z76_15345 [Alphaproteobacteria bacterium]
MTDERPVETPPLMDSGLDSLLADCKAVYGQGYVPALQEAICTVREHKYSVPNWVWDAVLEILGDVLNEKKKSGRIRQLRSELKHYKRWLRVVDAQVGGDLTLEKSYETALDQSATEGDAVDIETIKKSYKRVYQRLKKDRSIYRLLDRIRARSGGLDIRANSPG